MDKTIKQIADELKLSKQAIRKRINQLPPTEVSTNANGTIFVSEAGVSKIKTSVNQVGTNLPPTVGTQVDTLVDTLKNQLEVKDKQISEQQQTIKELTSTVEKLSDSLRDSQALHAGTMQKQLTAAHTDPDTEKNFFKRIFTRRK